MRFDTRIEKKLSPLIPAQFPEFYRENAPLLVNFLQTYYRWMEGTDGPLYHGRRILDYADIDETSDDFLVHFRKKYTPDIQLETAFNPRLLLKYSLDLYRSRGSERAIDLFFRLVYGAGAEVYFPGHDLLRPSDGEWVRPIYLEISFQPSIFNLLEQTIQGSISGATAFVERYVRKKSHTRYIDILHVSNVKGTFKAGEILNLVNSPLAFDACPKLLGSLTLLQVVDGGRDFAIGDLVSLDSISGYRGIARVASLSQVLGAATFELGDGGYGYSANADGLVSEQIITISNTIFSSANNPQRDWYFSLFDNIVQPLANLNYQAATGSFLNNDPIFAYYPNNSVKGTGTVLSVAETNATEGQLFVAILSGNLSDNAIFTTSNLVSANLPVANGFIDLTATGNVIGEYSNVTLDVLDVMGTFSVGEEIFQNVYANGSVVQSTGSLLKLSNCRGVFTSGEVGGRSSGAICTVSEVKTFVGVINVENGFLKDSRAPLRSTWANTQGEVSDFSTGSGASITPSANLLYSETVSINNDLLLTYQNVALQAAHYGFPGYANANTLTPLQNGFSNSNITIGKVQDISFSPGSDYSFSPIARIYDGRIYPYLRTGWKTDISINNGSFVLGEIVTQDSTGVRGAIAFSNSSFLRLRRLSLFPDFALTTNSLSQIMGAASGTVANVSYVEIDFDLNSGDISYPFIGVDAEVSSNTQTSNGAAGTLQVLDSGFGFSDGDLVQFALGELVGTALANVSAQGTGSGYYRKRGGFPSGEKHLQDGVYWQDFSYEVQSSVFINKYEAALKKILHVAGTKYFGAWYHKPQGNSAVDVAESTIFGDSFLPIEDENDTPIVFENGDYWLSDEGGIVNLKRTYPYSFF